MIKICVECIAWRLLTTVFFWRFTIGETFTIVRAEECKQDCHDLSELTSSGGKDV